MELTLKSFLEKTFDYYLNILKDFLTILSFY